MPAHPLPAWALGPFSRPLDRPILGPTPVPLFDCPMRGAPVRWAENHLFNPAAIVAGDRIHLLFRAEDGRGDVVGGYTSRIGLAVSDDGLDFEIEPAPVLFPDRDDHVGAEWQGGCEDPRIVEGPDGRYFLYYTQFNRGNPLGLPVEAVLGVASSRDLRHWEKLGPVFRGAEKPAGWHKAAGVVQEFVGGRLRAAKIRGRFWMYWGEEAVHLASSDDLIHWTPVREASGALRRIMAPRPGHFDSLLTEIGPPPVLTADGIVLLYNGKNDPASGDPTLGPGAYAAGQALFDATDPARLLERLGEPFLRPELACEKTGQYREGTVFVEGLVPFAGHWFLYYGMADTALGVATAPLRM